MASYTMTIDGAQVGAERAQPVTNPATAEVFAEAPLASHSQLGAALDAAGRAYTRWRRDDGARRQALRSAAEAVKARADVIARSLTLEQGKPLAQAHGETLVAATTLERLAEMTLTPEVVRDDDRGRLAIHYRPLGVTAGITPWNFPLLIAATKIAPALRAGNTMVLKPSPFAPLSTLQLGQAIDSALPPGVLNVISGGGELGAQLTADRRVKKVSFTGSIATGKRIAAAAAADLKRLTLELGGNDAAIVLDDVDPTTLGPQLFWSAFINCGQVCIALKRLYVPEAMVEPVLAGLVAQAQAAKVGDGLDPQTQIGPINNGMQLERVTQLVEQARAENATIHCGGERLDRPGYFYAPTIVSDVSDDLPLVKEEQFGPVLPVLTYRTLDEAIERANATPYGLGASVWGGSGERARAVAEELEAGTVWINQHGRLSDRVPFAGAKWSGLGSAGGRFGLEAFAQRYVINERK